MVQGLRARGFDAPVLFMSGYPRDDNPEPGDGFMAKPFSRIQLLGEVRRMLDGIR